MEIICMMIAKSISFLAELGAGFLSAGVAYEPHVPESLIK